MSAKRRRKQRVVELEPDLPCAITLVPREMLDHITSYCYSRDRWTLYKTCHELRKYIVDRIQKRQNGSIMTQALYTQIAMIEGNYVVMRLHALKFTNELITASENGHFDIFNTFYKSHAGIPSKVIIECRNAAIRADKLEFLQNYLTLNLLLDEMRSMTHIAIRNHAIKTACWLIQNPKYDLNLRSTYIAACQSGDIEVIDTIFNADNYKPNDGLLEAAAYGKIKAVEYFLDHGADDYESSLLRAIREKYLIIVEKIFPLTTIDCDKCFREACRRRAGAIMKYFKDLGATSCNCGVHVNSHDFSLI
jgi:hypothetical protein